MLNVNVYVHDMYHAGMSSLHDIQVLLIRFIQAFSCLEHKCTRSSTQLGPWLRSLSLSSHLRDSDNFMLQFGLPSRSLEWRDHCDHLLRRDVRHLESTGRSASRSMHC